MPAAPRAPRFGLLLGLLALLAFALRENYCSAPSSTCRSAATSADATALAWIVGVALGTRTGTPGQT
jgi:hypothetical protein